MLKPGSLRAIAAALLISLLAACGAPQGGAAPTNAPSDQPTAASSTEPTAAPTQSTGSTDSQPTAAPADTQPTAAPSEASGGVLHVARTAAPDSLNPGAQYIVESGDISTLVYDALISYDDKLKPIPQLAKEWSNSEDGTVWTFKLYENAKWHDGQPVTAEDVAFTYNFINGFESFGLIRSYTDLLTKAEATDPATVVLTFSGPPANWVERFSAVPILPKHIWEQFKDEKSATEYENKEMIGSGPFKLAEFRPGQFTRLTAVKDHYLEPPKIDEIIFQVYQNDDAQVQALKTGEVDLISPLPTTVRALRGDQNIKVAIGKGLGLADIIFNITTKENCPPDVGKCTGHPALKDVKVRQALAHATDKQQLIEVMRVGLAEPGTTLVMPGHGEAYNSGLQDYAFDIAQANKILDDAGYKDSNGDGIREMPNDPNTPLSLRFSWPSDQITDGQRFGELLRDMWKQAGVELKLQPLQNEALTSLCCPAFDFDVIRWGWSAGADPSSLLNVATTEQIPTGASETGYSNPEYDQLYIEQGVTVDPAKRKEILFKMQEILLRDTPYIIAWYPQSIAAYRVDRFQGWVEDPEGLESHFSRLSFVRVTPVK
jgi:peptide/nickel transport system substrate-binding protein